MIAIDFLYLYKDLQDITITKYFLLLITSKI